MKLSYWEILQKEQNEWQRRNFGVKPEDDRTLLGMTEELGELAESLTPNAQIDAVGDVMLYMAGFCDDFDLSLELIALDAAKKTKWTPDQRTPDSTLRALLVNVGKVAHGVLKARQGIRTDQDHESTIVDGLSGIVCQLHHFSELCGFSLAEAVETTWARVKERDWKKNKVNGQ